jgi:predicted O-methyltransferase YrrM
MNIDLSMAEATQGWISHKELEWLAKQAQKHAIIVEIGSYLGRSTKALADNTKGVVYAIDDFKGPRDMNLPAAIRNNIYDIFTYNVGDRINDGHVIPVMANHGQIDLEIVPDMVFIDGSHLYDDVKRDITYWWQRLAPKGLLCGHDYINLVDVKRAVDETLSGFSIAPGTSIWHVQK